VRGTRQGQREGEAGLTRSWVERLNCFWRLTTVRDTLKKSMASQAQANHLHGTKNEIKVQSDRNRRKHLPREEETPLCPSKTGKDFQQRPRSLHFLSLRNEVSHKVWGHRRGGGGVGPNL
jgi:hypothetical protein